MAFDALSAVAGHLLGRDAEVKLLTRLLSGIGEVGSSLVLVGEPGIGKSRLLAEAERLARERDGAVLRTIGVQSEAHLAFAGLHQSLRRVRGTARARRELRAGVKPRLARTPPGVPAPRP